MGQTVNLKTKDGVLKLLIGENGWSQVQLIKQQTISLGAEGVGYIIQHLITILDDYLGLRLQNENELVWVLSLFEKHSAIYACCEDDGFLFYFQDGDGKKIDTIFMMRDECKIWRDQLLKFVSINNNH